MSLDELDRKLPHGFHDAMVQTLEVDYRARTASIRLDLWTGDVTAQDRADRERRRPARLDLVGLEYLAIDPPDPTSTFRDAGDVSVDLCAADSTVSVPRPPVPPGFSARFFVSDWNAFIHLAARAATLRWVERR